MTNCRYLVGAILLGMMLPMSALAQINQVLAQGETRANEGAQAQKTVENLADQAGDLLNEYRQVLKVVDGLNVYNGLLQRQIDSQVNEKGVLADSIEKVSLIERQIVPLMIDMIDTLEEFIRLDIPFLTTERSERIEKLRVLMERSDVSKAEQFRRVIEAYQIENEYGRTIEVARGSLTIGGNDRAVDFLRIGRIAYMYQSLGGGEVGAYNREIGAFEEIPPAVYKSQITNGLRVADKQKAPDMIVIPVPAPGEATR